MFPSLILFELRQYRERLKLPVKGQGKRARGRYSVLTSTSQR